MRKMKRFCPKRSGSRIGKDGYPKAALGRQAIGGDLHGPAEKVERSCGGGKNRCTIMRNMVQCRIIGRCCVAGGTYLW